MLTRFLNEYFLFQVKVPAPQSNFGDIPLLAPVQPVLPTLPAGPWGRGLDAETNASGVGLLAPPADGAPVRSPVSVSATVIFESSAPTQTPVPAQIQTPVPVSAQAAVIPEAPSLTLVKVQTSIPVAPTPGHTFAKAPLETSKMSSATSDTSPTVGECAHPAAAPVPAPVLQPGIQTTVPECASLITTQQNLESTSVSTNLQQETSAEVGIKPDQFDWKTMITIGHGWSRRKIKKKTVLPFLLPLHKILAPLPDYLQLMLAFQ